MNIINRNRKPHRDDWIYQRRQVRLQDQVQRLQTYNTLLRDTLEDLHRFTENHCLPYANGAPPIKKRVIKVIGL